MAAALVVAFTGLIGVEPGLVDLDVVGAGVAVAL